MISNNKISNLVASQLPFYVRNDHENFVAFMEAYYEFLEQQTGALNISKSLLNQMDIDQTDLFANNFYNNFISLLPKNVIADKNLLVKNIKDFYRSRGSEKSARFLMRILFNEEVDFYYPKVDILKASDGKWFIEKSLKITDIEVDNQANNETYIADKFIGTKIKGQTSNATAIVESVDSYFEGGSLVKELKISNIYKSFTYGETISSVFYENGVLKTISANLFSGGINTVEITNAGSRYSVGDPVIVEGGNGSGAVVTVGSISSGNLSSIAVLYGGAGFVVNNRLLFSSTTGSGATGNVLTVKSDGSFHPNSYNICWSTIALEANTQIGNTRYANLNPSVIVNSVNTIANSVLFFTYANTGPIVDAILIQKGSNYSLRPTISAEANNFVRNLGILGRMEIIDGGKGYRVNDVLTFTNVLGGYGTGAAGRVKTVNTVVGNAISSVEFVNVPGQITGGSGYDQFRLPTINVVSSNASAYGANIVVTSLLGYGETIVSVGSTEGAITSLVIQNRGSGYDSAPTLNLKSSGDGTAQAISTIITGAYEYPGRYLNDDGQLSSYNFIQDKDYYQQFSYVLKLKRSLSSYSKALKELIHPAGMRFFGEFLYIDNGETSSVMQQSGVGSGTEREIQQQISLGTPRTYTHRTGNVTIQYNSHGLANGNTVYVQWGTGNVANANANSGLFIIKSVVNSNNFIINTSSDPYLSNTLLPVATGTANVFKIVV